MCSTKSPQNTNLWMKTGCTEILQLRIYRDSSVNKFSTLFANLNLYENKVFRKYLESVLNTFIKTVWYSVFLSFTDGFLIFFYFYNTDNH